MTAFEVRLARPEDARGLAELFAAVAEERDGIATEPPVDVDARTEQFAGSIDGTILAVAAGYFVGSLHVDANRFGVGELGMAVAQPWRGDATGRQLRRAALICRRLSVYAPPRIWSLCWKSRSMPFGRILARALSRKQGASVWQ